jgi:hypothetical protein
VVVVLRLQGNAPAGRYGPLAGQQLDDGMSLPFEPGATTEGFPLGVWETTYRSRHRDGTIDREQAAELEELPGWRW